MIRPDSIVLPGATDALQSDVYCANCGYNLRTLSRRGRCPECGRSVARTLLEAPPWLHDAAWRRRVERGLIYVVAGIVLEAVMLASLPFVASALETPATLWRPWLAAVWAWLTLPAVVLLVGQWNVAAPEAGGAWDDARRAVGLMVRGLAVLRAAGWLAVAVFVVSFEAERPPAWLIAMADVMPGRDALVGMLAFVELAGWSIFLFLVAKLHRESGGRIGWIVLTVAASLLLLVVLPIAAVGFAFALPALGLTLSLWRSLRRVA